MGVALLQKTFIASGAIGKNLIVKCVTGGSLSAGLMVALAAANNVPLIGVNELKAAADGEQVDVTINGIAEVICGSAVAIGDWVTADSAGKAVPVGSTGGTNYQTIGRALLAGSTGDIIPVHLSNQTLQG